ncbi:MAG: hypothetical protein ACI863_000571 [Flavobacteriales bacterium]|jgi:hypothetical protein
MSLTREQIKSIVKSALQEVADFSGEIDDFTFIHFQEFSKQVFANKLVELVKAAPYHDESGGVIPSLRYDIILSMSTVNSWVTINDCINYVVNDQGVTER